MGAPPLDRSVTAIGHYRLIDNLHKDNALVVVALAFVGEPQIVYL